MKSFPVTKRVWDRTEISRERLKILASWRATTETDDKGKTERYVERET